MFCFVCKVFPDICMYWFHIDTYVTSRSQINSTFYVLHALTTPHVWHSVQGIVTTRQHARTFARSCTCTSAYSVIRSLPFRSRLSSLLRCLSPVLPIALSLSLSLSLCRLRTHSFSARILFGISIIFTVSFSTLRRSAADGWQLLTVKLFRQFFVSAKTCAYFRSHCELFLLLL